MPKRARFIGFAFASADFLMEVDTNGDVAFAMGAQSDFTLPGRALRPGACAADLFPAGDAVRFLSRVGLLKPGERVPAQARARRRGVGLQGTGYRAQSPGFPSPRFARPGMTARVDF
jgi:hypothetical protein